MRERSLRLLLFVSLAGFIAACCLLPAVARAVPAVRVKDLTMVRGVRPNRLIGYGLVIGLQGTGDSNKPSFTKQSVASMLSRMGLRVNAATLKLRNVASVIVTAELPPFSRAGNRIDVTVSSVGDAKSLSGGTLLGTPLKGHDGRIYVIAQGPLTVGGYTVAGAAGVSETRNHPTVARVPGGGLVEAEPAYTLGRDGKLVLQLRDPDFTTAARLAATVSMNLGGEIAHAQDSGTVVVTIPEAYAGRVVEFLSIVERLKITPDTVARVVANERTGTIIMGEDVKIGAVAVTHGNLTVRVKQSNRAVPAGPMTPGRTQIERNSTVEASEDPAIVAELEEGATLSDVVEGLNRLGASPRDLITILQAVKQAGALRAELEIQ